MAKDGYLIFDSDTHVGPSMDVMERYLSTAELALLEPLAGKRRVNKRTGQVTYLMGERKYERRMGEAEPQANEDKAYMGAFTGAHKGRDPHPDVDREASARIGDMDFEGVDVNLLLPSGWFGCWTTVDTPLELALYRAYHRWMADYCGAYPDRLTGVILVSGRDVEGSLPELRRCAREPWALSLFCYAPYGMPLDHPSLEPYWAIAAEHDLSVVLHTFTVMPPYAPGGLDTWENLWLQRSAAHPWCGMRNMAAILGAGVLDRYPDLRLGVLEAGHGWLPFWAKRLDEHAHSISGAVKMERLPTEYITSGRFFQSIEMSEGEEVTKAVMQLLGTDILMYASDYPHGESWFPESVHTVMAWDLAEDVKRKLFWDNAVRFYRRYTPSAALTGAVAAHA
jgi:predicted TIM-barrel fold metal-dependent hydrolase